MIAAAMVRESRPRIKQKVPGPVQAQHRTVDGTLSWPAGESFPGHLRRRGHCLRPPATAGSGPLRRLLAGSIHLHIKAENNLYPIKVDPTQLEQAITILALNARDAMPEGGTITIETFHRRLDEAAICAQTGLTPGPYTVLKVKDTGCGMDDNTLSHLFEPFFTTKDVDKGTGLGLAVVYGTVKQSGGHIEVESSLGRGSTFTIYLPGIAAATDAPMLAFSGLPGGTETILLVEDEARADPDKRDKHVSAPCRRPVARRRCRARSTGQGNLLARRPGPG
jgi:hypothetical protein